MIQTIIEILLIPTIFLIVTGICYWLIEYNHIPRWLQWKPWNCEKCLSTWSLIGVGISFLLIDFIITGLGLIVMGILNGIARQIDEKNKTITIEEYDRGRY